jgi:hypothetical protein
MKKRFNFVNSLVLIALLSLASCGGDDNSPNKTLILGSMWDGTFYTVNTSSGELTELFTPTLGANDLTGLRAFVYHPTEKKFFAAQSYNYGAHLYTIDPGTGVATLLKSNDNGSGADLWRTIPSWFVDDDGDLFAYVYDYVDGVNTKSGFTKVGTNGNPTGTFMEDAFDSCCGLGMVHFTKSKRILVANGDGQDNGMLDFFLYDEDGEVKSGLSITEFIGFTEDIQSDWWTIRSMASESGSMSDVVFGIMVNSDTGDTYLVELDFQKFTVTKVANLDETGDYDYAPLTFVPKSVLN